MPIEQMTLNEPKSSRTMSPRPIRAALAALVLSAAAAPYGAATAQTAAPSVAKSPPGAPSTAAAAGEVNPSMCIGCHGIPGYKSAYPTVYSVPLIAGQPVKYLEAALIAYRRGDRSHPTMQAIARGLTEEQIAGLAQYYGNAGAK